MECYWQCDSITCNVMTYKYKVCLKNKPTALHVTAVRMCQVSCQIGKCWQSHIVNDMHTCAGLACPDTVTVWDNLPQKSLPQRLCGSPDAGPGSCRRWCLLHEPLRADAASRLTNCTACVKCGNTNFMTNDEPFVPVRSPTVCQWLNLSPAFLSPKALSMLSEPCWGRHGTQLAAASRQCLMPSDAG